jgi:hypothetical protein
MKVKCVSNQEDACQPKLTIGKIYTVEDGSDNGYAFHLLDSDYPRGNFLYPKFNFAPVPDDPAPAVDVPNLFAISSGNDRWYFNLRKPLTKITVERFDKLIASGWSYCHPEDTYSAEIGVRKAREQIFRKYGLVMNRDARIKLNAMFKPKDEHLNMPIGDFLKHRFDVRPLRVKCVNDDIVSYYITLGKIYDVSGYRHREFCTYPEYKINPNYAPETPWYYTYHFSPYTLADERADARAKEQADEAARMIARSKAREDFVKFIEADGSRSINGIIVNVRIIADDNDWMV